MSFPLLQDVFATIAAALALASIARHVFRGVPAASHPSCNGCPLRWTDRRPPPFLEHRRADIVANLKPID